MKKTILIALLFFFLGFSISEYRYQTVYKFRDPDVLRELRNEALANALRILVHNLPFDEVKNIIRETYPQEEPWMHNEIGHVLGELAYFQYGINAFGQCDAIFNYGCFHGVVELLGRIRGPDPAYFEELKEACDNTKGYKLCSHPLGHAATMLANYDVFKALQKCDEYYREEQVAFQCWFGAIMEYNSPSPGSGRTAENRDWLTACQMYKEKYKGACVQLQLHKLADMWNNDFQRLAWHCRSLSTAHLIQMCADELGFVIGGYNHFSDPNQAVSICDSYKDLREQCLLGIVRTYRTSNDLVTARKVCNLLESEENRSYCLYL